MIKQSKGITLIALVITIIVLLILAGISIQAITNTGIFTSASQAKQETQRAQVKEWLNLKLMEEQMHNPTGTAEEIIEATRAASDGNEELAQMGKVVVVDANTSTIEDGEQVAVYFYVQVDEDVYKVDMKGTKYLGETDKIETKKSVTEIKITPESATLKIGETLDLSVTISPEDAYNKNIKWISSNPEVATTDQNGKLTAVAVGTSTITATAQDESGVQGICTIEVKNPNITLSSIAKPGDYVEYDGENGYTGKWQVLYNDSTYGLQIISSNTVTDSYTLSGKDGYDNAVNLLNKECRKYVNSSYATSGRCVGTNPLSPDDTSGTTTYWWGSTLKNADTNYTTDYGAMKNATSQSSSGIHNLSKNYWLASRRSSTDGTGADAYVRFVDTNGVVNEQIRLYGCAAGYYPSSSYTCGIRPIITLKSGIQTNDGDGSQINAYKLVAQ